MLVMCGCTFNQSLGYIIKNNSESIIVIDLEKFTQLASMNV